VAKYGTAKQTTDDNIEGGVRCACWITEATETHSECVIRLVFAQQQWLRKLASMLSLYVNVLPVLFSALQGKESLFVRRVTPSKEIVWTERST